MAYVLAIPGVRGTTGLPLMSFLLLLVAGCWNSPAPISRPVAVKPIAPPPPSLPSLAQLALPDLPTVVLRMTRAELEAARPHATATAPDLLVEDRPNYWIMRVAYNLSEEPQLLHGITANFDDRTKLQTLLDDYKRWNVSREPDVIEIQTHEGVRVSVTRWADNLSLAVTLPDEPAP